MNPIQKQWLGLGVAVMVAMLIFPPWTRLTHQVVLGTNRNLMQTETQDSAGYSLLLEPPKARQLTDPGFARPATLMRPLKLSSTCLLLQWLTVAFLTGAGLLYFKDSDKKFWPNGGRQSGPPSPQTPTASCPAGEQKRSAARHRRERDQAPDPAKRKLPVASRQKASGQGIWLGLFSRR